MRSTPSKRRAAKARKQSILNVSTLVIVMLPIVMMAYIVGLKIAGI